MNKLYAVVSLEVGARIEAQRDTLPIKGALVVTGLDLTAIMGPDERASAARLSKAELARDLLAFQQMLEALLAFGPLLPAAYGSMVEGASGALALLIGHATVLREGLVSYGPLHQYQITVKWEPVAMLKRLAASGQLGQATLQGGPSALAAFMERYKLELARTFSGMLGEVAADRMDMPNEDSNGVMNITLVLYPEHQGELDTVLEAIDATATEALHIKMVGPLPACAFASLRLEHPDAAGIAAARRMIRTDRHLKPDALKLAYRDAMRSLHPDLVGGRAAEAASAPQAYDLLRRISEVEQALADHGVTPADPVPLVRLLRADGIGLAA